MRSARYSTEIADVDPFAVSLFLFDLRNDQRWRREIVSVEVVEGTAGQPGTVYQEEVRWAGIRASVQLRVVDFVIGRRLIIESIDPTYDSRSAYEFTESAIGTLLNLEESFGMSGPGWILESLVWGRVSSWIERDIRTLGDVMRRPP